MDRRIKKTRQALQEALIALILEKGYEAITVQDVLDRANVGRSTFYAHFYDLEDLLHSEFEILQAEFEQHRAKESQKLGFWELIGLTFQHANSYRNLYKAVIGKESGRIIHASFQHYLSAHLRESLKADYGDIESAAISLELLETYLVSSFMALLAYWLDKGSGHSAEEMAQIYQTLVKAGLDRLKGKASNFIS